MSASIFWGIFSRLPGSRDLVLQHLLEAGAELTSEMGMHLTPVATRGCVCKRSGACGADDLLVGDRLDLNSLLQQTIEQLPS